jgi:hypothetical protein
MVFKAKAGQKEFLENISLYGGLNYFLFFISISFLFCLWFVLLDNFYCSQLTGQKYITIIILTVKTIVDYHFTTFFTWKKYFY